MGTISTKACYNIQYEAAREEYHRNWSREESYMYDLVVQEARERKIRSRTKTIKLINIYLFANL